MEQQDSKGKRQGLLAGTYKGNKVPRLTEWIYSMSGIFRDACYALISGSFLTYAKTAGLLDSGELYQKQLTVITILYIVCLIWDGFNDPIMGLIVEKCHFKTGKFRPWILIGAVGNFIMLMVMFWTRPSGWWFVACFGIYYFLWDFVFTMNDIGYWSMLPSLTNDAKERNKLTTMVTIATTIGNAAMYVCTGLLVNGTNNNKIFGYLAIPTGVLFLASQLGVFFFCKEKERDPIQEKVSDKTKFSDLFRIFAKNKPLRMIVISIFAYYLLGAILTGFGYDYFYFVYGYGGSKGGAVATYFLGVYIVSAIIAQVLYPVIAKHLSQKRIFQVTFYCALAAFLAFFLLGAPLFGNTPIAYSPLVDGKANPFNGTGWLIFIPVLIFSASIGIMYLAQLVMMQNAIDYNEWKFGERKEAVAFAWRPLDAKLSAAVQKGIYMLALVASGTLVIYDGINDINTKLQSQSISEAEASAAIDTLISSNATKDHITVFAAWFIGSILVCLFIAYWTGRFGYKLSEEEHEKIVADLETRHEVSKKALESSQKSAQISSNK